MSNTSPTDPLAAEFDALMARSGLTIPPARRAAILAAYAEFRGQMGLLSARYGHEAEPANIFRLSPVEVK